MKDRYRNVSWLVQLTKLKFYYISDRVSTANIFPEEPCWVQFSCCFCGFSFFFLAPFTCSFITGRLPSCSFTGLIGPWLDKWALICSPVHPLPLEHVLFCELGLFLFILCGVGGPALRCLWWCTTLEMWQVEWMNKIFPSTFMYLKK